VRIQHQAHIATRLFTIVYSGVLYNKRRQAKQKSRFSIVLVNSTVQQYGMVDSTTVVPARSTVDVYSLVMDETVLHETVVRFVAFTSEYETTYLEALRALGYV
jgi:hypothetical protein